VIEGFTYVLKTRFSKRPVESIEMESKAEQPEDAKVEELPSVAQN